MAKRQIQLFIYLIFIKLLEWFDDIDMSNLVAANDVLEENELDRIHKFNERISHLFLSLQSLQEKLSGIENFTRVKVRLHIYF